MLVEIQYMAVKYKFKYFKIFEKKLGYFCFELLHLGYPYSKVLSFFVVKGKETQLWIGSIYTYNFVIAITVLMISK